MTTERPLTTWKEVEKYLGRSKKTCKRWLRAWYPEGIPRPPVGRGVFVYASALREKQETTPKQPRLSRGSKMTP